MSKIVSNYTANGSSTTDEYGTFIVLNRFLQGDVVEGFAVVANGTPNLTVLVQPGSGRIATGTYPSSYGYLISHDTSAGESVTISTPAASPRIDYIVAYIDKLVAGSTSGAFVNNTNNVLKFAAIAGTPAGSPNVPTVGQIQTAIGAANPYIILAQVAVAASVSTITNPNIADKRVFAAARNGLALGAASYVDNGCVWTATSGLAATMTAGLAYIYVGGVIVPVNLAIISSQTFLASKDTYVSVDNTGTVSIAGAVANNAASPTLPANSLWLAIVVTSASAVTSIYTTSVDSNKKLIRPMAPGTRQSDSNFWNVLDLGNGSRRWYRQVYATLSGFTGPAFATGLQSNLPTGIPDFNRLVTFGATFQYASSGSIRFTVETNGGSTNIQVVGTTTATYNGGVMANYTFDL